MVGYVHIASEPGATKNPPPFVAFTSVRIWNTVGEGVGNFSVNIPAIHQVCLNLMLTSPGGQPLAVSQKNNRAVCRRRLDRLPLDDLHFTFARFAALALFIYSRR